MPTARKIILPQAANCNEPSDNPEQRCQVTLALAVARPDLLRGGFEQIGLPVRRILARLATRLGDDA